MPNTSALPPAAAIFSAALPLNLCARTVSALLISPRARTLTRAVAANQPSLAQEIGRHVDAGVEPLRQRIEIDDVELLAEGIEKAALRHASVERHLTALEPTLVLEARTGLRTLVAPAGRLAVPGPLAAADPLLRVLGTLRRTQIVQIMISYWCRWIVNRSLTSPRPTTR